MEWGTIQNYFLKAGASFRNSPEWRKEFVDLNNKPAITLSGRFGIGAFAIFLLGDNFEVWTRHVNDVIGYHFLVSSDSAYIELERRLGTPIGTLIEIEVSEQKFEQLRLFSLDSAGFYFRRLFDQINWYCWEWPIVEQRVVHDGEDRKIDSDGGRVPIGLERKLPPEWSEVQLPEFKRTVWTYAKAPELSINGMEIRDPSRTAIYTSWWSEDGRFIQVSQFKTTRVFFRLQIQRYGLTTGSVTFAEPVKRDVYLSFIAHSIILGPTSRDDALCGQNKYPLCKDAINKYDVDNVGELGEQQFFSAGLLRWCATQTEMVPLDETLFKLLKASEYFVFGSLGYLGRAGTAKLKHSNIPRALKIHLVPLSIGSGPPLAMSISTPSTSTTLR